MKLSKSSVDRLEPREKQYTVWDSDLKGFCLSVNPAGTKTYYIDYRTGEGRRRRMSIGRHGAITTDQARKLAIETLGGIVLQKEDPLLERRTKRASLTLSEFCDQYLEAAQDGLILGRSGKPKKITTLSTDKGRIEHHIKPLLGRRLVVNIKRADITKFIHDVSAGKTAFEGRSEVLRGKVVVSGGAGTAARTTGLLSGILSYAVSLGIIEHNPAHGVKRPADNVRQRRISHDEFAKIGKILAIADHFVWQAIIGIKFLALTGCRLGEVNKLKWSEVDLGGQCLRLGDTKTGASTRPIGKTAIDLLKSIDRDPNSDLVFCGVRDPSKPYGALDTAIGRIMKIAEIEGVTAHTFRHSFASIASDLEYSDNTIGIIIGHAGGGVTSRYTHRLDSVLIAAADRISEEIAKKMAG